MVATTQRFPEERLGNYLAVFYIKEKVALRSTVYTLYFAAIFMYGEVQVSALTSFTDNDRKERKH
jgi:hypothetical protein